MRYLRQLLPFARRVETGGVVRGNSLRAFEPGNRVALLTEADSDAQGLDFDKAEGDSDADDFRDLFLTVSVAESLNALKCPK